MGKSRHHTVNRFVERAAILTCPAHLDRQAEWILSFSAGFTFPVGELAAARLKLLLFIYLLIPTHF
ncbi:MAG: hypothetical protein ABGX05_03035, partial [Pirellulaceae bacterium]